MTRQEALELLNSMAQKDSDMNHYLETEAIMRMLAEKLSENTEYWAMAGLLHDVDWALTQDEVEKHCSKSEEILKENGFDDDFIQVIQSHG